MIIYIDEDYRSTVYSKQRQTFGISIGSHTVEAVAETIGHRIQESFTVKQGESYLLTLLDRGGSL